MELFMKKIRSLNIIIALTTTLGFITHCNAADETGLRVVRGNVTNYSYFKEGASPANPVIISGGGFSLNGGIDSDRKIKITFKEPFKDNPTITATSNVFGDSYGDGYGTYAPMCFIWNQDDNKINGNYKNNFWVRCKAENSGTMATQISFIAIGK
jgi:hypothetical protein